MTTEKLRLAVLICDQLIPSLVPSEGSYYEMYSKYVMSSLEKYNARMGERTTHQLDGFDIRFKEEYPDLDKYDGIIITGSSATAWQKEPWIEKLVAFMASAVKTHPHINIIAICFGHQIMARALGGTCELNNGVWETGIFEIALNDTGKELFGAETINIQQMHRDHVSSLPDAGPTGGSITQIGSTPLCPNQGYLLRRPESDAKRPSSIQVLAVQGHPEFTKNIVSHIIEARGPRGNGVMDAVTASEGQERAGWHNDGDTVIGKAVWDVLTSKA